MLSASTVLKDRRIRIKTGLTIATARILPNIVRCYRCHMLGHNQQIPTVIEMNVKGYLLTMRQEVRYLGMQLDCRRSFGTHLEKVCEKADGLMGTFRSLSTGPPALLEDSIMGSESRWCYMRRLYGPRY